MKANVESPYEEIGYFNQTSEGKKGDEFDVSEGSRALSV